MKLFRIKKNSAGRLAFAGLGLLFSAGCGTPPDLTPFTGATVELTTAIKSSGRTVSAEVVTMAKDWPADEARSAEALARKFEKEWSGRDGLANALLNYSASLTAIAEAGEQGEKSAKAVAESVKSLCDALDAALPPAAAVDSVVSLGASLYGKYAKAKAAKTLGESMTNLQPVIDAAAKELGDSMSSLEAALDAIYEQNAANAESRAPNGTKVSTLRDHLKMLTAQRDGLFVELGKLNEAKKTILTGATSDAVAGAPVAATTDRLAVLEVPAAAIRGDLEALNVSIQTLTAELAPVDEAKAADRERLETQIRIVRTVRGGLADWAEVHGRLAAAALEKQPLQVADLTATALEIQTLVQSLKK